MKIPPFSPPHKLANCSSASSEWVSHKTCGRIPPKVGLWILSYIFICWICCLFRRTYWDPPVGRMSCQSISEKWGWIRLHTRISWETLSKKQSSFQIHPNLWLNRKTTFEPVWSPIACIIQTSRFSCHCSVIHGNPKGGLTFPGCLWGAVNRIMKAHHPSGVGSSYQVTNTSGYFKQPSCAEINWCRRDHFSNKNICKKNGKMMSETT